MSDWTPVIIIAYAWVAVLFDVAVNVADPDAHEGYAILAGILWPLILPLFVLVAIAKAALR